MAIDKTLIQGAGTVARAGASGKLAASNMFTEIASDLTQNYLEKKKATDSAIAKVNELGGDLNDIEKNNLRNLIEPRKRKFADYFKNKQYREESLNRLDSDAKQVVAFNDLYNNGSLLYDEENPAEIPLRSDFVDSQDSIFLQTLINYDEGFDESKLVRKPGDENGDLGVMFYNEDLNLQWLENEKNLQEWEEQLEIIEGKINASFPEGDLQLGDEPDARYQEYGDLLYQKETLISNIEETRSINDNTERKWDGTMIEGPDGEPIKNMVAVEWTSLSDVKGKIQLQDVESRTNLQNLTLFTQQMSINLPAGSEQTFDWNGYREKVMNTMINQASSLESVAYDEMIIGRSFYDDAVMNIDGTAYKDLGVTFIDEDGDGRHDNDSELKSYVDGQSGFGGITGVDASDGFSEDELNLINEHNEGKKISQDRWIEKATNFVNANPDNPQFAGMLNATDDEEAGVINHEEAKLIITEMINNPDYRGVLKNEMADYFTQYLRNNWNMQIGSRIVPPGSDPKNPKQVGGNVINEYAE